MNILDITQTTSAMPRSNTFLVFASFLICTSCLARIALSDDVEVVLDGQLSKTDNSFDTSAIQSRTVSATSYTPTQSPFTSLALVPVRAQPICKPRQKPQCCITCCQGARGQRGDPGADGAPGPCLASDPANNVTCPTGGSTIVCPSRDNATVTNFCNGLDGPAGNCTGCPDGVPGDTGPCTTATLVPPGPVCPSGGVNFTCANQPGQGVLCNGTQGTVGSNGTQGAAGPPGMGACSSLCTLHFESLTIPSNISLSVCATLITNYNYTGGTNATELAAPIFSLSDASAPGKLKFILLSNDAVAPSQIQAREGSYLLLGGDNPNSALVYGTDGPRWDALLNDLTWFPSRQQGPRLTITPSEGGAGAQTGAAVALSADGNLAVIGGPFDSEGTGAVWTFTRDQALGVWSQQQKIVDPDASFFQGSAVDVSADGSTLIFGAPFGAGDVLVYVFDGLIWTKEAQLPNPGTSELGSDIALSADGNTAASVSSDGVVIWVRAGTIWTLQAGPFIGNNTNTVSLTPASIDLSANGSTLAYGIPSDSSGDGAVWIFYRVGSSWSSTNNIKLVAFDLTENSNQGADVALSATGRTLVVGAPNNNDTSSGAIIIWTASAQTWSQQGPLQPGALPSRLGTRVCISSDGNTIVASAPLTGATGPETPFSGAIVVFQRVDGDLSEVPRLTLIGTQATTPGSPIGEGMNAVDINADGTTAIAGSKFLTTDALTNKGAFWVFV